MLLERFKFVVVCYYLSILEASDNKLLEKFDFNRVPDFVWSIVQLMHPPIELWIWVRLKKHKISFYLLSLLSLFFFTYFYLKNNKDIMYISKDSGQMIQMTIIFMIYYCWLISHEIFYSHVLIGTVAERVIDCRKFSWEYSWEYSCRLGFFKYVHVLNYIYIYIYIVYR